MELIERVAQLERELKALRPDLHFPSTATLEHRLRWLEIVLEEISARDTHSIYAETPSEENPRELLAKTVYIKQDRITLHSLTADPGSCVGGDTWFRSDLGKAKLAIDAVVANAKLLRREGDTIPGAEINPAVPVSSSGTYTGDTSNNRAIAHGLGVTPKIIFIYDSTNLYAFRITTGVDEILCMIGGTASYVNLPVTAPDATNFYVGNDINSHQSANGGTTYYWVAIG